MWLTYTLTPLSSVTYDISASILLIQFAFGNYKLTCAVVKPGMLIGIELKIGDEFEMVLLDTPCRVQ